MSDEHEKLRRLIASGARTKQDFAPYYMQNDMEPPSGGRSLLHDENGRPLYKKSPIVVNRNAPVGETPDVSRIKIKGTRPEELHPTAPLQQRTLNPTRTAPNPAPAQERFQPLLEEEQAHITHTQQLKTLGDEQVVSEIASYNDNPNTGIPVHVGNHEDHGWYDEHVTGSPIDNNDYVNTDALQGAQRLPISQEDRHSLEDQQAASTWSRENPPRPVISDVVKGLEQEEMCVLIKGDPIYVSSDKSKIIRCVEEAMMKYEIPIADILVIKRMGLDFGLTMK